MAHKSSQFNSPLEQKLNSKDLFFMAMGQTIGAGIITNTGIAIGLCGTGVILAYFIAFLVIYIGNLPILITGSVHPVLSPAYVFTDWVSPKLAGFFMYTFLLGRLAQAYMGAAFGTYLASITGINASVSAVVILTIFYLINLLGIKSSAKVQNITTFALIASILSFVILGLPKVNCHTYFLKENFFYNDWLGIFNAVAILLFGVGGSSVLVQFGPKAENPKKNIPKMTTISYICAFLIFSGVAFVGAGVAPIPEVAGKPMTYQASIIYPGNWHLLFVIGGALLAIVTTINANYIAYYTGCIKGVEAGWYPRFLAKRNRFDVPWPLLTLFWLMAIIPNMFGMQIGQLASLAAAVTLAPMCIPLWGLIKLPEKDPEGWAKSFVSRILPTNGARIAFTSFCTALLLVFIVLNFMTFTRPTLILASSYIVLSVLIVVFFGDKIMEKSKEYREGDKSL